jgi:uncharacterized protein with HEPN domain
MHPKSPKLLEDIRDAAQFKIETTAPITLADFETDRLVRQAVERNFEIIGEALNRLSRLDPEASSRIGDTHRIIGFRNILIHGYDLVDSEIVFEVIHSNLPELLASVTRLLGS